MADKYSKLFYIRANKCESQLDLFEGEKFNYRNIVTNDRISTEQEVIEYYNQRGASDKTFDIQNNDFGWNHLPVSNMNSNGVKNICY